MKIGGGIDATGPGPEAKVLLECLRRCCALERDDPPAAIFRAAGVRPDAIDWNLLTLSAGHHGVLPLIYQRLKSAADAPPHALDPMRAEFYGNSLICLHLTRELARIVGMLKAERIDAISFKGPVLALKAWGGLSLRQFNDLDLLVRPGDAARAMRILMTADYRPRTFDLDHPAASLARRCEDELMRPGEDSAIDLHWELNPAYFAFGPAAALVWARAETFALEGNPVLTLADDDLVLFLAVHGSKHGWINLGWIADFDRMVRTRTEAEVLELAHTARRLRCLRMFLLATALAVDLLRLPVAPAIAQMVRDDPMIARLVSGIERRLFASLGMRARLYSEWAVPIGAIAENAARLRYIASRALNPTIDDFDFMPLPRTLYPLYYAIRPVRLVWQQGRRFFVDVPHPLKRLRSMPQ